MYFYSAYGLKIASVLRLPELIAHGRSFAAGKAEADVTIQFGKAAGLLSEGNGAGRHIHATAEGVYLSWHDLGTILVRGGREIIVDPIPGVEECVLRLFLLGPILAMLLHQRGQAVVLHASVIVISGQAVAFVGVKGMGKSTMAATLHARGHDLLADDVLALDMSQHPPIALPGFPHLKLWPDAIVALGHTPGALPRLRPELEKRGYRITTGFSREAVPLSCIYVLGHSSEPQIQLLRPQEALTELMPHWYGARYGIDLVRAIGLPTFFRQCANLADRLPIYRLNRPLALQALPQVARLVEEHLAHDVQEARR